LKIAIIDAMAENRVIGRGGKIPWKIPADMKHFVELTAGHPVIMGRKTYSSIPEKFRPLDKGRTNIVMTRHPSQIDFNLDGVQLADSPVDALAQAIMEDDQIIFIAGGSEVYELLLPQVDTIFLTRVCAQIYGDSFFPKLPDNIWKLKEQSEKIQSNKDQFPIMFKTLVRQ